MLEPTQPRTERSLPNILVRMWHIARSAHPGWTPQELWRAASLLVRQVVHFRGLRGWYRDGNSPLEDMLAWRPSIVAAVKRPYISAAWDAGRRLRAIEQHYLQLTARARPLRLDPGAMVRLATIEARGETIDVTLDSPSWFVHEGELTLNLFHGGDRIYTLVFSLGFEQRQPVAFIGALQGLGSERAREIYRRLTHAFHGLRPRDLLMAAFRLVCAEVGVQRMLAVSDRERVSASAYFGTEPRVHSSYDAVWSDHLGQLREDGFFELPIDVARRTHQEIPSRKRSEYRQRYEMLDQLHAALVQALHARSRP